jgi:hypothetical protein
MRKFFSHIFEKLAKKFQEKEIQITILQEKNAGKKSLKTKKISKK